MTLFRLALRSHLGGFAATTLVGILLGVANTVGYAQIAGPDPAQRALFARQMEIVGRQLSYLLPIPVELETLSGYLQWRMFGTITIIYGFWALLAGSGAGRGDEERGVVEMWLAAGVGRARYLAARSAAFLLAAAGSIAVMIAATWVGSVAASETLGVARLALQALDLLALTAVCFAWTLVVAQGTTTRRGAGGIAGVVLLALFLVNSASRSGGLEAIAWLSPFWLHDRSAPLLRAATFDAGAVLALALAAAIGLLVGTLAFRARDLGASLLRTAPRAERRTTRPSRDPLLRLPILAILDQQRWWVIGWTVGLAALAAFLVSLTRTMVDALLAVPTFRVYIERLGTVGYDTFVSVIWGSTALLLLALFAIFQVSTWVSDDADGRLEAVLTQPVSRARVAIERVASLTLGAAVIALAGAVTVWFAAASVEIPLSTGNFVLGSALMITVPAAFGAIGAVIAGWRPRVAVPLLTIVAIAGYFTQQFAPLFDWPKWVENTSIYALYGQPIAKGVEWGGMSALVAIVVGGTALGLVAFERRDVGR